MTVFYYEKSDGSYAATTDRADNWNFANERYVGSRRIFKPERPPTAPLSGPSLQLMRGDISKMNSLKLEYMEIKKEDFYLCLLFGRLSILIMDYKLPFGELDDWIATAQEELDRTRDIRLIAHFSDTLANIRKRNAETFNAGLPDTPPPGRRSPTQRLADEMRAKRAELDRISSSKE